MGTVQSIKTPKDIVDLLDLRRSATGFQRAHIVGDAFAKEFAEQWFSKLFGKNLLGQNNAANGVLLPEASRGGFVLGAGVHNQEHVPAFNDLFYNNDPNLLVREGSPKWMNRLERQLRRDLADLDANLDLDTLDLDNPNEASVAKPILDKHRVKMRNFLDTTKIMFLHQEYLAKIDPTLKSLVLNDYDIRHSDDASVTRYLNQLNGEGALDFRTIEDSQLFKDISARREALALQLDGSFDYSKADVDLDRWIIDQHPDASRILYPLDADGKPEVLWSKEIRADILSKDAVWQEITQDGQHLDAQGKLTGEGRARLNERINAPEFKAERSAVLAMLNELPDGSKPLSLEALHNEHRLLAVKDPAKLATHKRYISARANYLAKYIDDFPENLKGAAKNLLSLMTKGLESPYAGRIALSAGGGLLALADMWVEADRRGGFTSPDFLNYLKEQVKGAVKALPLILGGMHIASKSPLGNAAMIVLGAVGTYLSVRKVLDYITQEYEVAAGQENTALAGLYYQLKNLNEFLIGFEKTIGGYIQNGLKEVEKAVTAVVDAVSSAIEREIAKIPLDQIQFVSGQSATIVSDKNEFVVGDDLALVQGDKKNNVLIHKGAGEVLGAEGDDTLIGFQAGTIYRGEAIDGAVRAKERPSTWNAANKKATEIEFGYLDDVVKAGNYDFFDLHPQYDRDTARAEETFNLKLDGGAGKDWVVAIGSIWGANDNECAMGARPNLSKGAA
jgi:hypothetical protein